MAEAPMVFDPILGWVRSTPLPFWMRSWRTLFRSRPWCPEHNLILRNEDAWGEHFVKAH